jgi:MFS family permease
MDQNVRVILFYTFFASLSEMAWGYSSLSGYLSDIGGNNAKVGLAEGLQGIAQLVAALFAGHIADKVNRIRPIRFGISIGFLSIVILWIAMYASFTRNSKSVEYWCFTFGLVLFRGIALAPIDALFQDSILNENRPKRQVQKYIAMLLGATAGPMSAAILFHFYGDTWTYNELRFVIVVGTALNVIPLLSLLFLTSDNNNSNSLTSQLIQPLIQTEIEIVSKEDELKSRKIRWISFLADLLAGLASGMTIKFFPLFFRDYTHLSPADVNTMAIFTTTLMICGSLASQKLSVIFGRVKVILVYRIIGISLLFVMALNKSIWDQWELIVPIYVIRTMFMNCTAPLQKSILMDNCPKNVRGKWSAADSIVMFGWSGSAFIGGILADEYGYGHTFFFTAIIQFIGFLLLLMLLPLVKDEVCIKKKVQVVVGDEVNIQDENVA